MRARVLQAVCVGLLCLNSAAGASEQLTRLDAEGLRSELEALNGRVVLVNFWATWCRPCLNEIPTLMKLQSDFGEQGFTLLAVSLDDAERDDETIKNFMDQWFRGFSTFLNTERYMDRMVSVIDPAWNEILPTTYLVSRDGSVAERIQGALTEEQFAAKIRLLLD